MLYAPIYLETSLPIDGWIQGCIVCNANTSNTILYKDEIHNNIGYMVYCCRTCKQSKERNAEIEKEYNDIINDYLDTYKEIIYEKVLTSL
jgi:transcription elongation factor Elf1